MVRVGWWEGAKKGCSVAVVKEGQERVLCGCVVRAIRWKRWNGGVF